ncbi:methyl-accepting chemotaxis protein [Clostridium kluyveri]|uniref:Predicted methyl-accepting chemotaxis protein n=2 Tax=Clostridium kluyveri TaxID=1534 RepID=A5N7Q3_CLOK5|nr:methyl-accepting chemotaxis protein [Clostridium kluyveri]EDK33334.1 Predicted methyl-accepting chemotaxis protein [Clostridium kluyveri DSM 555]BAH06239.1 hypothetical protein CKR_1188 [Clostridium kluyveri NBRC 12016]
MKTIKHKIILVISVTCVLSLLVSSAVSYFIFYNSIIGESKNKISAQSDKYAEIINGWIEGQGKIVSEIGDSIQHMGTSDDKKLLEYLKKKTDSNFYSLAVYVGFNNKKYLDGSGWVPDNTFVCTKRIWYKNAVEKRALAYSEPYVDAETKKMIISISKPIIENNEVVAVVSSDIRLDTITNIIDKAKPISNSYAFLIDNKNNFMVHPNKDFKPTAEGAKNITKVMGGHFSSILNKNIILNRDYDGKEKYFTTSKINSCGWTVGLAVPKAQLEKPLRELIWWLTLVIGASLILAVLISMYFGKKIGDPILSLVKVVNKASNFDLTSDHSSDYLLKRKDEIGQLANAFNIMREELTGLIKDISHNSQKMSIESKEFSKIVKEISSKIQETGSAVKSITDVVQESGAVSEEISASIEEVDSSINELSSKAEEGSNNANEFRQRSEHIKAKFKSIIENIQNLYNEKEENVIKAIEDGKVVENIVMMADTISSIAEQINLLALNASIEAARAGEQGKGFAVVAEEVGKLAEQSSQAVSGIKETIIKVKEAFEKLSYTTNEILHFINDDIYSQFVSFQDIGNQYYNDSDYTSKMSNEIAAFSQQITATINQLSEAVQFMALNIQNSLGDAETIRTNIDKNTKSIGQVAVTAQGQTEMAEKLNKTVKKFKI